MLPFTAGTAMSAGFTKSEIRRHLTRRAWHRVRRNAYVVNRFADALPPLLLQAGSVLPQLQGRPAISHESAATLWNIPHLRPISTDLQISRDRRSQGRCDYDNVIVHHAKLPEEHVDAIHSIPITIVARTVIDIARMTGMRAGLVAAEAALRQGMSPNATPCSMADFRTTVSLCRGWPSVRTARWVIEHASPLSESPLESVSRAAFYKYGVPAPEQQAQLSEDIRVDFLWTDADVVGEADGDAKYGMTTEAFQAEKSREQRIIDMGFTVLRWGWGESFVNPAQLAARINRTLKAKGMDVSQSPSSWHSVGKSWFLPAKHNW